MAVTIKIDVVKNFFLLIGSAAGAYAFIRLLFQDLKYFFVKPKLTIEFNPREDLQIWAVGPPYLKKSTLRKVATVHVRNTGKNDARECEAFLEIIEKSKVINKSFPLHWADTLYNAFSTSIEPITIRGLPRRLDVVFTEQGRRLKGCSIAASQALATGLKRDQFLLTQGEYKARISVRCSNGRGARRTFLVKSPDSWNNLIMEII
jgi:hypothetical protein